MPARKTTTPGTIPGHFSSLFRRFPQWEILRIMPVSIYALTYARQHVFKLIAGELTIAWKAFNIVINIAIDFVGNTLLQQTFNDSYHLGNMLCGARKDAGRQYIEFGFIIMECLGVKLRDLQRGLALLAGLGQHFILAAINHLLAHMTHIGDIFDVQYLEATIFEIAAYPVGHGKGAQVANVNVPVDGGTTRIH